MELSRYSDETIASGDPVIVRPIDDGRALDPVCLGTGFEGIDDLRAQIDYVRETGESTQNISEDKVEVLRGRDSFSLYLPVGRLS